MSFIIYPKNDTISKIVYSNGLTVVTESNPFLHTACVGVWIKTGSGSETRENNGISHFIEHLLFKGVDPMSGKPFITEIESRGGQINAFTDREFTCYYTKIMNDDIPIAIKVLGNMISNRDFSVKDFETEKKVVQEEIRKKKDSINDFILNTTCKLFWGSQSYGLPVVGNEATICALSQQITADFLESSYTLDNIVISIIGNMSSDLLTEVIDRHFGGINKKSKPTKQIVEDKTSARFFQSYQKINQSYLSIGFPGVGYDNSKKINASSVLNGVLSGGITGRLPNIIREEFGLAYSVVTQRMSYKTQGLFIINTCTCPEHFERLLDLIFQQLKIMRQKRLNNDEISQAKRKVITDYCFSIENLRYKMAHLAQSHIFFNRLLSSNEAINEIQEVSTEDVNQLVDEIFFTDKTVISAIGPFETDLTEMVSKYLL